ncbi:MAG: DnaD domain protein [Candidatus Izimaplasma sp.]|nr:DnaD domain protein [Candidatus Izimaplasma bacterium]
MDAMNMKQLIKKNIIDFSELVLNNYYKLGLDETDAIIIIKLHKLLKRNITFIHPKKLSKMLSITSQTTNKRLDKLMDKGFIKIELIKSPSGKETESFNLDLIIEKIIKKDFEEKTQESLSQEENIQGKLVDLFETEFRKPLSPLDIQVISKWLQEDKYTYEQIKDALFQASKANKLSINYVDAILLRTNKDDDETYNRTTLLKDLKKIWTE